MFKISIGQTVFWSGSVFVRGLFAKGYHNPEQNTNKTPEEVI